MRRHHVAALLATLLAIATAFNIDVKRPVIHRNTADTYFGYSIDIYQDATQSLFVRVFRWHYRSVSSISLCHIYRLLVGAPRAQTIQPNVRKGGAVFRCSVERPQCSEIFFDRDGDRPIDSTLFV